VRLRTPALAAVIVLVLIPIAVTTGALGRVLSVIGTPSPASPTSSTPTTEIAGVRLGLPTGVTLRSLGSGAVDWQEAAMDPEVHTTKVLELERITLAPDTLDLDVSGTFLLVEAGHVMMVTDRGLESGPYETGSQISLQADVYYGVRNVADDPAVLLRVNAGLPVAIPAARVPFTLQGRSGSSFPAVPMWFEPPGPEPTPIPGVETEILMHAEGVMPTAPAVAFLIRTTWPTGIELADGLATGLVALQVESGVLTARDPDSGLEVRLSTDQGLVYEPQDAVRLRAEGPESAQVLVLGLALQDQPLILPAG
jgi:hypothetical protein